MWSAAAEAMIKADGRCQGVAIAGGAFVLMAALYLLAEKYKTPRVQKRWEEVCRQILRNRSSIKHTVLEGDGDSKQAAYQGPGRFTRLVQRAIRVVLLPTWFKVSEHAGRCCAAHAGRCTVCLGGEMARMLPHV